RKAVVGFLGHDCVGAVDVQRAVVRDRHPVVDLNVDAGADAQCGPGLHGEGTGENVTQVDAGGRAHQVERQCLPVRQAAGVDVNVQEALIAGHQGHVDGRRED